MRALFVGCVLAVCALPVQAAELGLAIYSINYGPYDDPTDCPEGLALTPKETFLQSLSPSERQAYIDRDKRVGSLAAWVSRIASERRGPGGENACEVPQLIKDPPMRVGQSKTSYGMDLDAGDARNMCPHQEFVSKATGKGGIDNQVARLTACIFGLRKENNRRNQAMDAGTLGDTRVMLLRVSNVDDMRNDSDVTVDIYKSADTFIKDGSGKPVPDATMRGDKNAPAFRASTKGRIVDGVLMTSPVDGRYISGDGYDWVIKASRFEINLKDDGYGEGMLAGYFEMESFWQSWAWEYQQGLNQGFSCPALYEAMNRLADGYKDPATGKCTALSSAFNIRVVRTFIMPPEEPPLRVGENAPPARQTGAAAG